MLRSVDNAGGRHSIGCGTSSGVSNRPGVRPVPRKASRLCGDAFSSRSQILFNSGIGMWSPAHFAEFYRTQHQEFPA